MNPTTAAEEKQWLRTSDGPDVLSALWLRDQEGYVPLSEAVLLTTDSTAARLLGALRQVRRPSSPKIFEPVERMADRAYLAISTTRKALCRLCEAAWLGYEGRQQPGRSWRCRRTATYVLTEKVFTQAQPWFPWPCWLSSKSITPAAGTIYSIILGRWCLMHWNEEQELGNLDDRQRITYTDFQDKTGFGRATVAAAVRTLIHKRLIEPYFDGYDLLAREE